MGREQDFSERSMRFCRRASFFLVAGSATFSKKGKTMFKRILVPLDGSTLAERAFHVAVHLAHGTEGTVLAGRVVPPPAACWPSSSPPFPSAPVQPFLEA